MSVHIRPYKIEAHDVHDGGYSTTHPLHGISRNLLSGGESIKGPVKVEAAHMRGVVE